MPADITTDGGPVIGGNVKSRDFTGRDAEWKRQDGGVILNFNEDSAAAPVISQQALIDLISDVRRLIILIDGDNKYDTVGMRQQVKALNENAGVIAELSHRIDTLAFWNRVIMAIAVMALAVAGLCLWMR